MCAFLMYQDPLFEIEPPELSVVVPLFNEAENLPELYRRLSQTLRDLDLHFEIVLVNDGSEDATSRLIDDLQEADANVVALHLSRNFGHQAAVSAGLDHAKGRAVVLMDGDLQDPPELIPRLLERWRDGYEVVYAVRRSRQESPWKRLGYFTFYRLLRAVAELDIPLDSGDFCLMDRQAVEALRRLPERARFLRGLRTYVGFRQVGLPYDRPARAGGSPKYNWRALVRLAVDGLVSFSGSPLRWVTYLGIFSVILALGLMVWVFADAMIHQTAPRGWASLIVVVLFLSAVQLISLGIIGEYIRLIFLETKRRPTYIMRRCRDRPERRDGPPEN